MCEKDFEISINTIQVILEEQFGKHIQLESITIHGQEVPLPLGAIITLKGKEFTGE